MHWETNCKHSALISVCILKEKSHNSKCFNSPTSLSIHRCHRPRPVLSIVNFLTRRKDQLVVPHLSDRFSHAKANGRLRALLTEHLQSSGGCAGEDGVNKHTPRFSERALFTGSARRSSVPAPRPSPSTQHPAARRLHPCGSVGTVPQVPTELPAAQGPGPAPRDKTGSEVTSPAGWAGPWSHTVWCEKGDGME